jgi:hypothetical protein
MPTRQAEPRGAARDSAPGSTVERRRIVSTKVSAPPLRAGIVDRPVGETLDRTPKLSAEWFREAARRNAVV